MRNFLAVGVLVATVMTAGCYDEDLHLSVHDDGSGTLRISRRLGATASSLYLLAASEDEYDDHARDALVDELASWEGACAWTHARSRVEDGTIGYEATAYFEDVTKLRRSGVDGVAQRFALHREDGEQRLAWSWSLGTSAADRTLDRARAIANVVRSTRVRATVTLPDGLEEAIVSTDGERELTQELFSGRLFDRDLTIAEAEVEAGALSESEAVQSLSERHAHSELAARWRSRENPRTLSSFRRELAVARTLYSGSDLARDVEDAQRARR